MCPEVKRTAGASKRTRYTAASKLALLEQHELARTLTKAQKGPSGVAIGTEVPYPTLMKWRNAAEQLAKEASADAAKRKRAATQPQVMTTFLARWHKKLRSWRQAKTWLCLLHTFFPRHVPPRGVLLDSDGTILVRFPTQRGLTSNIEVFFVSGFAQPDRGSSRQASRYDWLRPCTGACRRTGLCGRAFQASTPRSAGNLAGAG